MCLIVTLLILIFYLLNNNKEGYSYGGPHYETIYQDRQVWDVLEPEYFGNNRSALEWNEKDYPMKTTNGLDLTPLFPQDSLYDEGLYIPKKFSSPL